MIRNFFVSSILAAGIGLVAATPLLAENGAFDKMYGNGVHAFFSSDYAEAHGCLSRAIDAESKDPRCFYFRGLAYLKLGREPEARGDFAVAADLEAVDAHKFYNVSKALQRVQGKSRIVVEQYRAKARLKAAARAAKLRRVRYEELRAAETRVLQQQAQSAPDQPVSVEAARPSDPFSAGPIEDEAPKAAVKPATGTTDPFADAPTEPKKGGGILGAIGKAVGKTAKGAMPSRPKLGGKDSGPGKPKNIAIPAGDDDPFGDDPFGSETPAPKVQEPSPKAPSADSDGPFGSEAPAPKVKKPAPKAPSADLDDPFS